MSSADNAWAGGAEDHHEEQGRSVGATGSRRRAAGLGVLDAEPVSDPTRGDAASAAASPSESSPTVSCRSRPGCTATPATLPPDRRSALGPEQRAPGRAACLRERHDGWTVAGLPVRDHSPCIRPGLPDDVADALRTLKLMEPSGRGRALPRPVGASFSGERDWSVCRSWPQFAVEGASCVSGDVHSRPLDSRPARRRRGARPASGRHRSITLARTWTTSWGWTSATSSRAPVVAHLVEALPHVHWTDLDSHGLTSVVEVVAGRGHRCEWYAVDTHPRGRPTRSRSCHRAASTSAGALVRVLVAPDKFAGTLTAVEAAEAIADGLAAPRAGRRARPGPDGRRRARLRRRAARGARRRAARRSRSAARTARPCPATVLRVGDDGVRRERAGLRAAPDRRATAEAATTSAVRRARRSPRSTRGADDRRRRARRQRHQRRRRRAAGRARAPPPTCRLDGGAAGLDRRHRGRPRRRPRAARRGAAGRRERRRHPADRPVRRHQDLRPAEGDRRGADRRRSTAGSRRSPPPPTAVRPWRRAPAPPAASATRCWSSAPPASPASTWSPTPSAWPSGPAPPTSWSPARAPSTSPAAPARCPTAWPGSPPRRCGPCVALAGQVLVGSREMRALGIESAYSLVDLVGEERAFAAPAGGARRARRAGRAHLVALTPARADSGE